eukprot:110962-Pyramimonas_sp.AAC.1
MDSDGKSYHTAKTMATTTNGNATNLTRSRYTKPANNNTKRTNTATNDTTDTISSHIKNNAKTTNNKTN